MKIKKIIVNTVLTGVAGLALVACGNKKDNVELVDENGEKYTVEETDDAEEIAKVIDSVIRGASEEKAQNQTKYGFDFKANAKVNFDNNETKEKYSISANANANLRLDLPTPLKDEEGNYTETTEDYFAKLGLSAGLSASVKSNFPGLDLDLNAALDVYSDEEKIYLKVGDINIDDLNSYLDEEAAASLAIVNIIKNNGFYAEKASVLPMLGEDFDLTEVFPFIDAYYESGYAGIINNIVTPGDEDFDATSFTPIVVDFVDTFNISISKVDGNNVTFKLPLVDDFEFLVEDYFDEDPVYTHDEIKAILDGESDEEEVVVLADLYATIDVKELLPVQLKFSTTDAIVDILQSEITDMIEYDLEELYSDTEPDETSISEREQNMIDAMTALAQSTVSNAEVEIVLDFVYGQKVNTISDAAKKDYIDITTLISMF